MAVAAQTFALSADPATIDTVVTGLTRAGLDITPARYIPPAHQADGLNYLTVPRTGVSHTDARDLAVQRAGLTEREAQTLQLLADELTDTKIGNRLGLTWATIKSCNHLLFRKLGATNRAHAVLLGSRAGILGGAA